MDATGLVVDVSASMCMMLHRLVSMRSSIDSIGINSLLKNHETVSHVHHAHVSDPRDVASVCFHDWSSVPSIKHIWCPRIAVGGVNVHQYSDT